MAQIHPVGAKIVREDGDEEKDTVKLKISFLKSWLKENKYMKIAELIRIACNYEVRNSFSHADYKLTKTGVYLTTYKREISYADLQESFLAAYYLLNTLSANIDAARTEFIRSGGYEESGWKIIPLISEEGFAIKITTSSPSGRPTGRKRTGLSTNEAKS